MSKKEKVEVEEEGEEKEIGPYYCKVCGKVHDNIHSDHAHKMCYKCRNKAFQEMRDTYKCCRCQEVVVHLTPFRAQFEDRDRFLLCPKCGLIISRDPKDIVRGSSVSHERPLPKEMRQ